VEIFSGRISKRKKTNRLMDKRRTYRQRGRQTADSQMDRYCTDGHIDQRTFFIRRTKTQIEEDFIF
jgi:hypothetical protein